jgi:hypothetical protein
MVERGALSAKARRRQGAQARQGYVTPAPFTLPVGAVENSLADLGNICLDSFNLEKSESVIEKEQKMDLSRLTEQSQEALRRAQALAVRRNHQGVDTPHLLAALLEETEGLAAGIFAAAGIAPSAAREKIEQELSQTPQVSGPGTEAQQVYFTQRLVRLLTVAEDEA